MIKAITPKKFLCKYPLSIGAVTGSVIFIIASALCALVLFIEVLTMSYKTECSGSVWNNAFSFSITGIMYCLVMIFVHLWLIWGVKKKKASIVLSWVVLTALWLTQTFCLLIVLLLMYSTRAKIFLWLLCCLLGLLAMCASIYITLVVYGLWVELKQENNDAVMTTEH